MAGHRHENRAPKGVRAAGTFYDIRAEFRSWYVSPETAAHISRQLDRRWRPRWIKFVDLHGSRVWIRGDSVFHLAESTELQRGRDHDLDFALEKEHSEACKRHYSDCDSGDE